MQLVDFGTLSAQGRGREVQGHSLLPLDHALENADEECFVYALEETYAEVQRNGLSDARPQGEVHALEHDL